MSSTMRISCPMCGQPLDRESIEETFIEFSTWNSCGRCGFGLDLRWRGRGSALSLPTPNILLVTLETNLASQFSSIVSNAFKVEAVSDPAEALGVYAKTLRKEVPLSALFVTTRGQNLRWSDLAVAIRALEEGFKVLTPMPIYICSSASLSAEEQMIFDDLSDVYWNQTTVGSESSQVLEIASKLIS